MHYLIIQNKIAKYNVKILIFVLNLLKIEFPVILIFKTMNNINSTRDHTKINIYPEYLM